MPATGGGTDVDVVEKVSLVIPARNAARTLRPCLSAVVPLLSQGRLAEIILVDDGSTDDTADIAGQYPVRVLRGAGRGPGAARNLGWRAAVHPLVWFIDSDCVAEADALERLLPYFDDPQIGGAGGSYGNMLPDSLLACLIHEEIVERHRGMPVRVNYLATFNVVYRRAALEQVGGFDERFVTAEDVDLAWRVIAAGYALAFELQSRVKHFHPARWRPYLRTQRRHGYFRARLYATHREYARGDAYSSFTDHVQPPLAMLVLASLPLLFWPPGRWVPAVPVLLLAAAQAPMTVRLVRRTGALRYLAFAAMSFLRAFWRGVGMTIGVLSTLRAKRGR